MVLYLQMSAPGAALWWFETYHNLLNQLSWQNWTWHIWQVEKTAWLQLSSSLPVAILRNQQNWCRPHSRPPSRVLRAPCTSMHITVPFGAEAPSNHVVQAWAIPPPSWGLLSRWHRQQTTTPKTNGASSAWTQPQSEEISLFVLPQMTLSHEKGI